jgi:GNAT superfamily N-acetyltransferase
MIRPGTPEDADGAARVHVETWQAYAHALPVDQLAALTVDQRAPGWRRWPPTFVAEEAAVIVGFIDVGASRDEDADAELFSLYVHPDSWGTGVGRALIGAGEERLRELRHTTAILWCWTTTRVRAASTSSPAGRQMGWRVRSSSSASASPKSATARRSRQR